MQRNREKRIIYITIAVLVFTTAFEIYYAKTGFTNKLFPSNIVFFSILNINIILSLLLLFMIFRNLVKAIFVKEKGSKFKLSTKLVISFFLFTTIPLIFHLFVSSIIIKSSINIWFNTKIESSLKSTLYVARKFFQEKRELALFFAERFLKNKDISEIKADGLIYGKYYNGNVQILTSILRSKTFEKNINKILEVLKSKKKYGNGIITLKKRDIIYGFKKNNGYFAIVLYYVGLKLHKNISKISKNLSEYSYLKYMKNPIEKTYLISLLLITLVIIFSATWFAFYIAKDITNPIYKLAKATQEISKGNLNMTIDIKSKDEIGILIDSFNKMIKDLKETRQNLIERQKFIENIVNNINSGVISIDKNGKINTINPFAKKLLNLEKNITGINYKEIDNPFFKEIVNKFITKNQPANQNFTIKIENDYLTLSVFFTPLKNEKNEIIGYLFVFNDLTQEMLAQKTAAWREVARRIAHEIKNPLTPIQLSAQRLKKKYIDEIKSDKREFEKIINTIVQHVVNIKNMVNEFSNFAKMPDVKLKKENLNEIINEVIVIYRNSYKDIKFETFYDEKIPKINIDRNLFNQALLNIIKNSIHSFESIKNREKTIIVETKLIEELKLIQIIILDNGCGIDESIMERIFEPYFSTKEKGTGIGLTIVKKIISDHNGYIRIQRNSPYGTKVIIELPVA